MTTRGYVKSKLFVLTLNVPAITWFKDLKHDSFDSWNKVRKAISSHFTARKRQLKTTGSLSNIILGKEEFPRDYIEHFIREIL
jgi:hypothetical protein